jgi:DNA-binding protein YbaB
LALDEVAVGGRVRDVNELAEMAIKALQDAASVSEQVIAGLQQPLAGEGADDDRYVQVTIVGGQVIGCRVSESWADGRDGHTLGAVLTQAARRAAEAVPSYSVPERGATDTLLADVLATLRYDTGQQADPGEAGLSRQEQQR